VDIFRLARFGDRLFNLAFGQIKSENGTASSSEWARGLRKTLREGRVIQIARI